MRFERGQRALLTLVTKRAFMSRVEVAHLLVDTGFRDVQFTAPTAPPPGLRHLEWPEQRTWAFATWGLEGADIREELGDVVLERAIVNGEVPPRPSSSSAATVAAFIVGTVAALGAAALAIARRLRR